MPMQNSIITITGILALSAAAIVLYRVKTSGRTTERSLQSRISALEQEIAGLKQKNRQLEQDNVILQEQNLEAYKKALIAGYEFNRRKGIFEDKISHKYFCPRCLINKAISSPLKTEPEGWKCDTCRKFYPDPDFTYPPSPNAKTKQ